MDPEKSFNAPLAPFRRELKIYRGPDDPDGSPTYNLFDPIRSKYYKITWEQSLIFGLFRGGMTAKQVTEQINRNTTAKFKDEEVYLFFQGMARAGLLQIPKSSAQIQEEIDKSRVNPIKWLLLHYLFIKIPLLNPDQFLSKTLPYVRPLVSPIAVIIYAILTILGIASLIPRFEEYLHTFTYFFNLEGIMVYALAIITVKLIHEFSHAYTAKYYGIHVPTMGLVLIVLWPALYTDVTHGWKLRNRRHRLAITFAGVLSELVIAGVCTLLWSLTSPGLMNSVFFILSSSTWLTSLFVNLNPAMRFDGYYLLSDLWGVDNLQPRAFAITRWKFHQWLLGSTIPPPEEGLSQRRIHAMVIYSLYTWIYRVVLYTIIALFVYHQFTKALGVFLFMIEILVFFIWPIYWEMQELNQNRPYIAPNRRLWATLGILGIIGLWFLVPLPHTQSYSAITAAREEQILYAPIDGTIEKIETQRGAAVKKGEILLQIKNPKLNQELNQAIIDKKIIETQIHILGTSEKTRNLVAQKQAELAAIAEKIRMLEAIKDQLTLKANIDGIVYEFDIYLKPGQWVASNQIFGKIADPNHLKAVFYIPETSLGDVEQGEEAKFVITRPYAAFEGSVTQISPINELVLQYPQLAANHALPIVETKEKRQELVDSYYAAEMNIESSAEKVGSPIKIGQTGEVKLTGRWHSLFYEFIRTATRVLWRESGT